MHRVTSRPRLVSDADRAFINATIDDEISDEGLYLDDSLLHHSGESYQEYLLNSAADLSQRIIGSVEPDKPPSAVVEDDTHTPIQSHDEEDCYLEYMSSRSGRSASTELDSLSTASVKRKRFSKQHYYLADPPSVSRQPGLPGTLSECYACDNLHAGTDRNDSGALGLAHLPEENVIGVSSYLTLQEVRQLSATSTAMRKILADGAGATTSIWVASMRRSFPIALSRLELNESGKAETVASMLDAELASIRVGGQDEVRSSCEIETVRTEHTSINFADEKNLCIAGVRRPEHNVNLSLLTGLIPSSYPQSIDEETLNCRSNRIQRVSSYSVSADLVGNGIFSQEESPTSASIVPVVRFAGQVGTGDRSVRSDQPFPENCLSSHSVNFKVRHKALAGWVTSTSRHRRTSLPLRPLFGGSRFGSYSCTPKMWPSHGGEASDDEYYQSEESRLSHNVLSCHLSRTYRKCMNKLSRHSSTSDGNRPLRPFVAPTVVSDCGGILTVDVTPSLVAYFEATIFHSSSGDPSETVALPREDGGDHLEGQHGRHECVAIGLSTSQFRAHSKMPG